MTGFSVSPDDMALIGESNRDRHLGCRVTAGRIGEPDLSVVLRTVWRVKKTPLGSAGNTRPDYQQLLSDAKLIIWIDSSSEGDQTAQTLQNRIRVALNNPTAVMRFGGLSLGESTHLVDEVCLLEKRQDAITDADQLEPFLLAESGRLTSPPMDQIPQIVGPKRS